MAAIALGIADNSAASCSARETVGLFHDKRWLTQPDTLRIGGKAQLHEAVVVDTNGSSDHLGGVRDSGAQRCRVIAARIRTSLRVTALGVTYVDDVGADSSVPISWRGKTVLLHRISNIDVGCPINIVHQITRAVQGDWQTIFQDTVNHGGLLGTGSTGYGDLLELKVDLVNAGRQIAQLGCQRDRWALTGWETHGRNVLRSVQRITTTAIGTCRINRHVVDRDGRRVMTQNALRVVGFCTANVTRRRARRGCSLTGGEVDTVVAGAASQQAGDVLPVVAIGGLIDCSS